MEIVNSTTANTLTVPTFTIATSAGTGIIEWWTPPGDPSTGAAGVRVPADPRLPQLDGGTWLELPTGGG